MTFRAFSFFWFPRVGERRRLEQLVEIRQGVNMSSTEPLQDDYSSVLSILFISYTPQLKSTTTNVSPPQRPSGQQAVAKHRCLPLPPVHAFISYPA